MPIAPDAPAHDRHQAQRIAHWDRVAAETEQRPGLAGYYHRRLARIYRLLIPPGSRVLELGCGQGHLLAALEPSVGVGVDFAPKMLEIARQRHPGLRFHHADVHDFELDEKFDYVILSDLVHDLWDVQAVFEQMRRFCTPRTRVILNFYSRLWQLPLGAARRLKLARPVLDQNWLTTEDVTNLLHLADFEAIRHWSEILWPIYTPGIAEFCNRFLAKTWPLRHLALSNFVVARPAPQTAMTMAARDADAKPIVSVIVPARNESGNIESILARTPEMAGGTEIVFVEGNSSDDTYEQLQRAVAARPGRRLQLHQQTGKGKGDAVRLGFREASGDILMILDADLTVPPEDLPRFVDALVTNKGEFINGVRLVYPMEKRAMRFLNLLGNKFFSLAFSWLLDQPIKDTLCGTKALRRSDYERIAANRGYFGEFDPFGDFDLLFGAAKQSLKIVDLPIRYRERTYGETNISRFRHGAILLRMTRFAALRLKFV